MGHKKLFQEGKISRQEYEALEGLKQNRQYGLYNLYETELKKRAKERERIGRLIEKGQPVPVHVRRAERMG